MTGAASAQNRRPPRLNHKKSRAGCQRCKARRVKVSGSDPFPNVKSYKSLFVSFLSSVCTYPLPALRLRSSYLRSMMNTPDATHSAMRPNLHVEAAIVITYHAFIFTMKYLALQVQRHHSHRIPHCRQIRSSQKLSSTTSLLPQLSMIL
jgi:hypothetical protein